MREVTPDSTAGAPRPAPVATTKWSCKAQGGWDCRSPAAVQWTYRLHKHEDRGKHYCAPSASPRAVGVQTPAHRLGPCSASRPPAHASPGARATPRRDTVFARPPSSAHPAPEGCVRSSRPGQDCRLLTSPSPLANPRIPCAPRPPKRLADPTPAPEPSAKPSRRLSGPTRRPPPCLPSADQTTPGLGVQPPEEQRLRDARRLEVRKLGAGRGWGGDGRAATWAPR
nr:basic proline-rich protein-like [Manis javanica]